ncbi:MAG: LuxR family transcriptional regulator, partial [Actinotalea sp.]|nr:LuxR family transcriptional regulator [Actinotalea sp.]
TWARELVQAVDLRPPGAGETALLRAMLHHDAGSTDAARSELAAIERGQAPCHVTLTRVQAGVLGAEIEHRLGNAVRAHDRLMGALEAAEPEGLVRPFADRPVVGGLLRTGQGRFGRHEAFVRQVLARLPSEPAEADGTRLTAAELAVLRELPSMLSLQEIADAHSVSVNTVKSHLRAVYRKLGVSGRRGAVEVGRRRGLL